MKKRSFGLKNSVFPDIFFRSVKIKDGKKIPNISTTSEKALFDPRGLERVFHLFNMKLNFVPIIKKIYHEGIVKCFPSRGGTPSVETNACYALMIKISIFDTKLSFMLNKL